MRCVHDAGDLSGLILFALVAVAIELPPETSDRAAARVVDSCQAVLGAGQCVLAANDIPARWRITVRWNGTRLLLVAGRNEARSTEVARREIVFSPGDSEEQRWVAAGLMVAALAAAQSEPGEAKAKEGHARREPNEARTPHPMPTAWHAVVDVGGLIGRGLHSSQPKLGVSLRGWFLMEAPRLGATASLHLASSFGDPELRWYGGSAGVGARLTDWSSPFGLGCVGEFVFEQARVRATRDQVEQVATSSWRGGGRIGLVASYRLTTWLIPWIAADISVLRPELRLRIADQSIGDEGDVRWGFSLGGRFHYAGD